MVPNVAIFADANAFHHVAKCPHARSLTDFFCLHQSCWVHKHVSHGLIRVGLPPRRMEVTIASKILTTRRPDAPPERSALPSCKDRRNSIACIFSGSSKCTF